MHDVEITHANESRRDGVALTTNPPTEPLVEVPPLLGRNYEHEISTRDRPARTGADARIAESVAIGEVRLALRPYGRENKAPCERPISGIRSTTRGAEELAPSPLGAPPDRCAIDPTGDS